MSRWQEEDNIKHFIWAGALVTLIVVGLGTARGCYYRDAYRDEVAIKAGYCWTAAAGTGPHWDKCPVKE